MSLFTEEEKNEITAYVTQKLTEEGGACLPLCEQCKALFPRISKRPFCCPCHLYNKKYVKDKFWRAME